MLYEFGFLDGECFWGGSVAFGNQNPFTTESDFSNDYRVSCLNQTMPFYVSNKGRYIWSDSPFKFEVKNGIILIEGEGVELYSAGKTLRDAYLTAMKRHFPTNGKKLPLEFFKSPQFNTWMEFVYEPTEERLLDYARSIIDNGFKPGILIIDEGWQDQYGKWEFDKLKFPDPKAMIKKLHAMGFKVLLWVVPWVRADGLHFVKHTNKYAPGVHEDHDRLFLRDANDDYAMMHWWNGISAMLDMRKDCDREFLKTQLKTLMQEYGVDGFKFDGGNICYGGYHPRCMINSTPHENHNPHELNIAWNEFGQNYEYHEYKDNYKGGGKNSIQRLRDCGHKWIGGVDILIPNTLVQGIIGHPFTCPDMVGGGEWTYSLKPDFKIDEEIFIRMTQASVLCPMVQFSWAPWRILSEKSMNIVKKAVELREQLFPYMLKIIENSFITCEPVIRSLEYVFPNQGLEKCMDAFMLGDKYLVAPVAIQGAVRRMVKLPLGKWKYVDSTVYEGGKSVVVDAPIDVLPYFEKL